MVNTLAVDNEAKQTIEALQNELQRTKEKLQAVEELKKQSGIKTLKHHYFVPIRMHFLQILLILSLSQGKFTMFCWYRCHYLH